MRLYHVIAIDRPCRFCGRPCYSDEPDDDVAHPCCRKQIGEQGQKTCLSCEASAGAGRRQESFGGRKAKPTKPSPKPKRKEAPPLPPPASVAFDGATYDPCLDEGRLDTQKQFVWNVLLDHEWHRVDDIQDAVVLAGGPLYRSDSALTARIRDFRKPAFGGHDVPSRRVPGSGKSGMWEYRLVARLTHAEVRVNRMNAIFDLLREADGGWVDQKDLVELAGSAPELMALLRRMVDEQGLEVRKRTFEDHWQFRIAPQ